MNGEVGRRETHVGIITEVVTDISMISHGAVWSGGWRGDLLGLRLGGEGGLGVGGYRSLGFSRDLGLAPGVCRPCRLHGNAAHHTLDLAVRQLGRVD